MKASQIQTVVTQLTQQVFASTSREFFAITETNDQALAVVRTTTWEEADGLTDAGGRAITRKIYSRAGARIWDGSTSKARSMTEAEFTTAVTDDLTRELTKAHLIIED